MRAAALVMAFTCGAAAAAGAVEEWPRVTHVGAVAPDVLAITVDTGRVVYGRHIPYDKRDGDTVEEWGEKGRGTRWVVRAGKRLGALVGRAGDTLWTFDRVEGEPLDTEWAEAPKTYAVTSRHHRSFRDGRHPAVVFRKSKPSDLARTEGWEWDMPVTHVLYLRFPEPLEEVGRYELSFEGGRLPDVRYFHRPRTVRSEAVHVSHVGFRPDDPVKVAFLSCWMGSGGALAYPEGVRFLVLDARTGRSVFEGTARLSKRGDDRTEDPYKKNYTGADVHMLDFSELSKPGTYVVSVEGIGCSYPFEIREDAWEKAFVVSARSFYHQRSGIELGPPHTDYRRPRCFHPDDGVRILQSTCPLMDSGNGLNARGTDKGNFGNLVAGKTDQVVPDAWGGYFDAGDWDRRIQHLEATRLLLELAELFPQFVRGIDLNTPESRNDLPDLVDECLWNLDCYRRMQKPEGGIRGGIESAEHPRAGEASWQESLDVMAYAPGIWSSHVYAGVAARAAGVLRELGGRTPARLAREYESSALGAMDFAERELPKRAGKTLPHAVHDARNLAAAEIFRLTGDAKWNRVFLETTAFKDSKADLYVWKDHDQREAAFVYARTEREGADGDVKRNARAAILREADASVAFQEGNGFRWTRQNPWEPFGWGKASTPQAVTILRAHALTGDAKYLRSAVLASQTGAGANPVNMCYTTGIGPNPPLHPLIVDQRMVACAPPPGITIYGPFDSERHKDYWVVKLMARVIHPAAETWPSMEGYFDVYLMPDTTEFTVMQTMGPNTYVWGHLAARE